MKNHRSIQSTYVPPGYVPVFTGKMADKRFNNWQLHIRGIKNLPKKGGVCHQDRMNSLLDQANEILTEKAK